MVPAAPVVRFRQFTVMSRTTQIPVGGSGVAVGGSVAKVTAPGAPVVADGVTEISGVGSQHMKISLWHPATYRTGTWNAVVVDTGTGGGFAVAAADEQSGRVSTATDARARAKNER